MVRYPKDQDPSDPADWAFMFVARRRYGKHKYHVVTVIRVHPDDDQFVPGMVLDAGVSEFVPLDE